MRSLKFRAWHETDKCWYNPRFIEMNLLGQAMLRGAEGLFEIIPASAVEQYTGLKDKNGKEIYEGDIVKAKIDGLWQTGAHTVSEGKATWNLEVIYNDIRYMDVFHILGSKNQPNRIYYLFDESISDIEVIGNIHENPELLEDK